MGYTTLFIAERHAAELGDRSKLATLHPFAQSGKSFLLSGVVPALARTFHSGGDGSSTSGGKGADGAVGPHAGEGGRCG